MVPTGAFFVLSALAALPAGHGAPGLPKLVNKSAAHAVVSLTPPGVPASRALVVGQNRRLTDYMQLAKLTASDAASYDNFGYSVAIDGATVVVGAYEAGTGGVVYVLRTSDGGATYVEVAKLSAADAASGDYFGYSVAIDGDTVVVGVYGDDDGGIDSGSVYVFRTSDGGATYGQVAKLTAADAASGDYFGNSVAIDGDTVVIGAWGDDDGGIDSGSVYVFRTSDGGATYGQVAKLTAADAASGDYFGRSVAIDGATVVVGAYGDDDGGSASGSVYVFRTSDGGATYGQAAKLTAADAAASDWFGYSVAIDGATVVIGAPYDDDGGYGAAMSSSSPQSRRRNRLRYPVPCQQQCRRPCQPRRRRPNLRPNRRHYPHWRRPLRPRPRLRRPVRHRCRVLPPRKIRHPSRRPDHRQCRPPRHRPLNSRPPRRPSRRRSTPRPRRRPIRQRRRRRPLNQPWFRQSLRRRRQRHRRRRPPRRRDRLSHPRSRSNHRFCRRPRLRYLRRQHQRRRARQNRRPRLLKSSLL